MGSRFLVFVYGTLKKGQPNHDWLNKPENGYSKFIANGSTTEKYPLIIATRYNIPFLLNSPGTGYNVLGEVYEIDEKMLSKLDELEDHPDYYVRRLEPIFMETESKKIDCWTYFLKEYKNELSKQTMFPSYDSKGDHGLVYCERYNRDPNYDHKSAVL